MKTSFLSDGEIKAIGFRSVGENVRISRNARFYNARNISIGDHSRIDDFCLLSGGKSIVIGSHVHIAAYCALFGQSEIEMGDFSGLSARVTIYTESDDYSGKSLTNPTVPEEFRPHMKKGKISIGRHVIIGVQSTLLPGVSMGEGSALGAHSFLTKSVPEWEIYSGSPARFLKKRSKELLELEKRFLSGG